jgi:hypothetical protein
MGRILKQKRLVIEQANRRLLNEDSFTFPIGNDNFNVGYDSEGLGPKRNPKVLDRKKAIHNSDYGGGDAAHQSRGGHKGIDIFAPKGTPVVACVSGKITSIGNAVNNTVGGNTVTIKGDDGKSYYYAHLDSISKEIKVKGDVVAGKFIGTVGDTGSAKGTHPHLHFSIYEGNYNSGSINPWSYLKNSLEGNDIQFIDGDKVVDKVDGKITTGDLTIDDIIKNGDNSQLISVGSKGDGVLEVQELLNDMGYDIGDSGENKDGRDKIFGFVTKDAVEEFQEDNDLEVDGIVGIETSTELKEKSKYNEKNKD